jgi:short-subunit dehydrogenase involved in D-alanine esterification of teichoic acids
MSKLNDKIVLFAGDIDQVDLRLVQAFLQVGTIVIVASPSKRKNKRLYQALGPCAKNRLVTLVADIDQPQGLKNVRDHIRRRFGQLDLMMTVDEGNWQSISLTKSEMEEVHRIIDQALLPHV